MDRKVKLTIWGLHAFNTQEVSKAAGEEECVQTVTEAEYFWRGGSHYLIYEEKQEGFGENAKGRIRLRQGILEMTRQGAVTTHMIFEENKTYKTPYVTPYGEFMLGINTKKLKVQEQEKSIRIRVEYCLEADGQFLSDSVIELYAEEDLNV